MSSGIFSHFYILNLQVYEDTHLLTWIGFKVRTENHSDLHALASVVASKPEDRFLALEIKWFLTVAIAQSCS